MMVSALGPGENVSSWPDPGHQAPALLTQPETQLMAWDIPQWGECSSGILKALGSMPSISSTLVYAYNTSSWKLEAQEVKVILGAI